MQGIPTQGARRDDMPNIEGLYKELLELPHRQYSDLIRRVDMERRQVVEREEGEHSPQPGTSRDEFAHWIGRRHFAIDKGISRIVFLPTGAPPDEVRLLEVNELAHIPEAGPIAAVDFAPDIEGLHYRLFVADVTPQQFEAVQSRKVALPAGWDLEGSREITPSDR
jgi:hypothetical protein